jgi:hypothetical protein
VGRTGSGLFTTVFLIWETYKFPFIIVLDTDELLNYFIKFTLQYFSSARCLVQVYTFLQQSHTGRRYIKLFKRLFSSLGGEQDLINIGVIAGNTCIFLLYPRNFLRWESSQVSCSRAHKSLRKWSKDRLMSVTASTETKPTLDLIWNSFLGRKLQSGLPVRHSCFGCFFQLSALSVKFFSRQFTHHHFWSWKLFLGWWLDIWRMTTAEWS